MRGCQTQHASSAIVTLRSALKQNPSQTELANTIQNDKGIQSLLRAIPMDPSDPIMSEQEAIEEAVWLKFSLNGTKYATCWRTGKNHRTIDMTRLLCQRMCQMDPAVGAKYQYIFSRVMFSASRSSVVMDTKHVLSVILLKGNSELHLVEVMDDNSASSQSSDTIEMEIFPGGVGCIYCVVRHGLKFKVVRKQFYSLLQRRMSKTSTSGSSTSSSIKMHDEARDEVDATIGGNGGSHNNNSSNGELMSFEAIVTERLSFSGPAACDAVRHMSLRLASSNNNASDKSSTS